MTQGIENINLAISFDQGYVPFVYVLLASVFHHNANVCIIIHALAPEVTSPDQGAIRAFVESQGGQVHFYALDPAATQGFALPNHETSYFTLANYYRLFFADLVPQNLTALLYLDIDTLVVGPLSELFQTDLGTFAVGAVQDAEMHLRTDLGLTKQDDYFNSGVLLINLPQWRAQRVTEQACDIAIRYPEKVRGWVDQDALNMLFQGTWYRLDWRYNVLNTYIPHDLPQRDYQRFLADKVIIHYTGTPKPWHWACENKLRFLYPLYAQLLPGAYIKPYSNKKASWRGMAKLLSSRVLETYFNHPQVGQAWRRVKSILGK